MSEHSEKRTLLSEADKLNHTCMKTVDTQSHNAGAFHVQPCRLGVLH